MINEELTDKTIKSSDKIKVSRVIADMLGVEKAETMSPDVAVNTGLRKIKSKRMTPEIINVLKKMLKLAQDVGVKVDQSLVPKVVNEGEEKKVTVHYKTHWSNEPLKKVYRAGNDSDEEITRNHHKLFGGTITKIERHDESVSEAKKTYKDFISQNSNEVTVATPSGDGEEKIDIPNDEVTEVGNDLDKTDNDHLRRMKVNYKVQEENELDEAKIGTKPYAKAGLELDKHADSLGKKHMDYDDFKYHAKALQSGDISGSASSLKHMDTAARDVVLNMVHKHTDKDISKYYHAKAGFRRIKEEVELEEAFVVHDHMGRVVASSYSEATARAKAKELSKKTGKPHTHHFDRAARGDIKEEVESEEDYDDEDDFTEKDLDAMVNEIDSEDDLEDIYDGEELEIVDDETGEVHNDEFDEGVNEELITEVMSRMARMRARVKFIQTKSKRARKLKIALKSHSSPTTLNKRARTLAIKLIKQRIMKKPVAQMSVAEKERAEKIVKKLQKVVNRLAMRLVPRIKKIESTRLSHPKFTKK